MSYLLKWEFGCDVNTVLTRHCEPGIYEMILICRRSRVENTPYSPAGTSLNLSSNVVYTLLTCW